MQNSALSNVKKNHFSCLQNSLDESSNIIKTDYVNNLENIFALNLTISTNIGNIY